VQAPELAELVDGLSVGICVWQLEVPGDRTSLVLTVCNRAAGRFLGVAPEAVLGRRIAEGFPGSLDTPLPGVFMHVIESSQAMNLGDVPYVDEVVPDSMFSIDVKPLGAHHALVEFTNVTQARRAEASQRETLEQAEHAQAEVARLGHAARELDDKLRVLAARKREMETLSSPIIEVWAGVLALPLIGQFDAERSELVRVKLLDAVIARKARHVILDLTGLELVDAAVAHEIARSWRALALLGARTYLTGISPSNAQIMAQLDEDLPALLCLRSLEEALRMILGR
jgi:anti-anti-sigma regulatory factor